MTRASELIVSVSGVRGIVGQGLTPEIASTFAAALGTYTGGGRIILSRDGRPSGLMLGHAGPGRAPRRRLRCRGHRRGADANLRPGGQALAAAARSRLLPATTLPPGMA